MKIPVYRSQMRLTSEAPGARITARKRAQPFVEAALREGEVITELAAQAGEYANMRYKIMVETQKNEAIFGAKEGLMELSRVLEQSSDLNNIFDGQKKYEEGVKGVYEEMRKKVGKNRYALSDFENSFKQMEIPIKFRLKEVVDIKIEKRRQAALKALEDQQVEILSDPYLDFTSDDLMLSQAGLQSIADQAVRNGGVNPEILGNVSERVLNRAAANVIPAYAGRDLDKAMDLVNAYSQLDQVRAGALAPGDVQLSDSIPNHVVNMLQIISPDDATDLLQDTLKQATTFFAAQEKLEADLIKDDNQRNTKAYNFVVSVQDSTIVRPETLQRLLPDYLFQGLDDVVKTSGVTGAEAKIILRESLNAQMWASPEQQAKMNAQIDESDEGMFADEGESSAITYSQLYSKAGAGMLDLDDLSLPSTKRKITLGQYNILVDKVNNSANTSLNVGVTLLSRAFKYSAKEAEENNPNLSNASKVAFENADFLLQEEFSKRFEAQDPMTRAEVRDFANGLINQFKSLYIEELQLEYEDYVSDKVSSTLIGRFSEFNKQDPINSLQDIYNSLDANEQRGLGRRVLNLKTVIRRAYGNQGLGF